MRQYLCKMALLVLVMVGIFDAIFYWMVDQLEGYIPLLDHFGMEG